MQKNLIKTTDEVIALLQKMSHEFHLLYSTVMTEYGKKEIKLVDNILNFGYKIIQTVGIVAGFGFTAIGNVKNIYLFVLGEGILLISIIYGVNKIKKIYTSNLNGIQLSSNNVGKILFEKSKIFQKIIPKALSSGLIDMDNFQLKLDIIDQKLIKEFSPIKSSGNKSEDFLTPLIIFLGLGGIGLLASFICF